MGTEKNELNWIREQQIIHEEVIDIFVDSLTKPIMYDSGIEHFGYRYGTPTVKHFCVLKAVRAVSGLNAALCLAEKGYNQEICTLVRTIVEQTYHIEFVLSGFEEGILKQKQQKLIDEYFSDFRRNTSSDYKRPNIRQEEVHKIVGRELDKASLDNQLEEQFTSTPSKELMSNVYLNFSNYIHARYPEVMDMYGGRPGKFHMSGMVGTPKDFENLAIIQTFTGSVSLCLKLMVHKFDMHQAVAPNPEILKWLQSIGVED